MAVDVEICRSSQRFADRAPGRMTWHTLSFGAFYDPERVAIGPLVCHDEHLLAAGRGFESHHHADVDIVTWVVSGALRHTDSLGGSSVLRPGTVGVLRAGTGVEHSEVAAAPQTRFVQSWLSSAATEVEYAATPVDPVTGSFTELVRLGDAALTVGRLEAGQTVTVPDGELRHLFVASGALLRNSLAEPLAAGDAYLLRSAGEVTVAAAVPTELLLWQLPA